MQTIFFDLDFADPDALSLAGRCLGNPAKVYAGRTRGSKTS